MKQETKSYRVLYEYRLSWILDRLSMKMKFCSFIHVAVFSLAINLCQGHGTCSTKREFEYCDEVYDGKCYVLITNDNRLNVFEARASCHAIGANAANIYSKEHFNRMVALIRTRIVIGLNYHHIWTGMELNTSTKGMYLSNGNPADYTRWFPGRPFNPARSYVGIHVQSDPSHASHGMFDENATYKLLGVLCEI
uniref:uncharacterized protein LOC120332603 n=1 Tax=Styela clava TaxID=7725 RepID=UPI001939C095|nr:uncharacterized protein LOC120332603 [Styela clava]